MLNQLQLNVPILFFSSVLYYKFYSTILMSMLMTKSTATMMMMMMIVFVSNIPIITRRLVRCCKLQTIASRSWFDFAGVSVFPLLFSNAAPFFPFVSLPFDDVAHTPAYGGDCVPVNMKH